MFVMDTLVLFQFLVYSSTENREMRLKNDQNICPAEKDIYISLESV